jgi:hypothetical protein
MMSMTFRKAVDSDIPSIVRLLKKTIGESLVPKSEGYWRWKHLDNPFGRSLVYVATDKDVIVGVRAFMRWKFLKSGETVQAVRAVDTAVDPDYQRMGLFKKLNSLLIEEAMQENLAFIFNTPNEKTRSGNLKMGWQIVGKLPISVTCPSLGAILSRAVKNRATNHDNPSDVPLRQFAEHRCFTDSMRLDIERNDLMKTDFSTPYLKWRYIDVPIETYFGMTWEDQSNFGLIVYRLKSSKFGTELRVTDWFINSPITARALREKMVERLGAKDVDYVTISSLASSNILPSKLILKNLKIGPVVTGRELKLDISDLRSFKRWRPSLGDLELF